MRTPPLLALIITGFAVSAAAPYLYRLLKARFVWFGVAFPLALFASFMLRYPQAASGVPVRERWSWVPSLGLDLSFVLDGLCFCTLRSTCATMKRPTAFLASLACS